MDNGFSALVKDELDLKALERDLENMRIVTVTKVIPDQAQGMHVRREGDGYVSLTFADDVKYILNREQADRLAKLLWVYSK